MAWLKAFRFGCGHCHGPADCPLADTGESGPSGNGQAGLRGAGLVLAALAVFIVPPMTAISGACLAGYWWAGPSSASLGCWQTVGLVAGLVVGVGFARGLLAWAPRRGCSLDGET